MYERNRQQAYGAAQQAEAVGILAADLLGEQWQEKGEDKAHGRVHAKTDSRPLDAARVHRRSLVGSAEHIPRHSYWEIQPHAEEAQPGEQLHWRQLAHGGGHLANRVEYFHRAGQQGFGFRVAMSKGVKVLWGIFRRG